MKKITFLLLFIILMTACQPASVPQPITAVPTELPLSLQDIANSWQEVLNKGDIDAALSYLAEDAVVTIKPAGPQGNAVFTGHTEIRGWYETLTAGKGVTTLNDCKVNGETITCLDTYADEGLKSVGVDFIDGDWVAVIKDDKIQSYTFTTSPASLAKLASPPEPTMVVPTNHPVTTPTLAPNESLANSVDDLIGKWWFSQVSVIVEFKADGTFRVYSGSGMSAETQDEGNYTFDAGKVTWVTSTACSGRSAIYDAYVTKQDGQLAWLRLQVVGSDPCRARRDISGKKGKFQNP